MQSARSIMQAVAPVSGGGLQAAQRQAALGQLLARLRLAEERLLSTAGSSSSGAAAAATCAPASAAAAAALASLRRSAGALVRRARSSAASNGSNPSSQGWQQLSRSTQPQQAGISQQLPQLRRSLRQQLQQQPPQQLLTHGSRPCTRHLGNGHHSAAPFAAFGLRGLATKASTSGSGISATPAAVRRRLQQLCGHRLGTTKNRRSAAAGAGSSAAARRAYSAFVGSGGVSSTCAQVRPEMLVRSPWDRLATVLGERAGAAQAAIINALNLVGGSLPKALGLLAAEMVRNSPLLGGARADAFETCLQLPAGLELSQPRGLVARSAAVVEEVVAAVVGVARVVWLAVIFAPLLVCAPLALTLDWRRAEWLEMLRHTLEAAGPAFIKWGQWAATRHDMFPPDLCLELEQLHTQAPAHGWDHTRKAVAAAFGLDVDELFEEVETKPVASGSIGQVHRARLSSKGAAMTGLAPGSLVAIKVRHPGVGEAIERDFATMVWLARALKVLPAARELRLEDTLKQFAAPLHEQTDLSREARNLFRFNHNFRKTKAVSFPTPLYPLVASDVLVESYEPGRHITEYIATPNHPYSHRLAELGSGTMLQMMLVDNLIHSDLHPGNILVRLDPPSGLLGLLYKGAGALSSLSSLPPRVHRQLTAARGAWLQPRIVLLDVGMATELTNEDQRNMLGLFQSFAALDGRTAAEWTLRFSGKEQECPDPEAFKGDMEANFRRLKAVQGEAAGSFTSGADALAAVLEAIRQHKVSLPGHICAVVVTTLVLEGWSNQLDPNHSVLQQVQEMFAPVNYGWKQRICSAVDKVMDDDEQEALA